tara:strand:+ start:1683 stop:1814 length:132 start_codon:yes stop_codon:yes gene_type:complete
MNKSQWKKKARGKGIRKAKHKKKLDKLKFKKRMAKGNDYPETK